ncbi:hypothetical protein [Sphingobacterium griseoflavum]|uniref:Uncharacterized protein n=1 Tax=Sphingobacterium griseoflavum TaxID=1474952 RepID=A0ABQ3HTU0_9SPHI|nr:hypothetical protein [Sphingobacterium griseoflavum]GHE33178.1 hypothetical protein GCM10017764_15320 [Sphingobacterium griseoflavum]
MEWKERLWGYNAVDGFYENPQKFNFEFSPERLIVRNLALRHADRDLYRNFLLENFPFHLQKEMEKFDQVINNLWLLTPAEAAQYVDEKEVNMMCADLDYREGDAIFRALHVEAAELATFKKEVDRELLENYVLPEQVLNRSFLWIDGSAFENL